MEMEPAAGQPYHGAVFAEQTQHSPSPQNGQTFPQWEGTRNPTKGPSAWTKQWRRVVRLFIKDPERRHAAVAGNQGSFSPLTPTHQLPPITIESGSGLLDDQDVQEATQTRFGGGLADAHPRTENGQIHTGTEQFVQQNLGYQQQAPDPRSFPTPPNQALVTTNGGRQQKLKQFFGGIVLSRPQITDSADARSGRLPGRTKSHWNVVLSRQSAVEQSNVGSLDREGPESGGDIQPNPHSQNTPQAPSQVAGNGTRTVQKQFRPEQRRFTESSPSTGAQEWTGSIIPTPQVFPITYNQTGTASNFSQSQPINPHSSGRWGTGPGGQPLNGTFSDQFTNNAADFAAGFAAVPRPPTPPPKSAPRSFSHMKNITKSPKSTPSITHDSYRERSEPHRQNLTRENEESCDDNEADWSDGSQHPERLRRETFYDATIAEDNEHVENDQMLGSAKTWSRKGPLQNESRPRQAGLASSAVGNNSRQPVPRTRTPTISHGMEARTQNFLKNQGVLEVSPGHDWLGTLIEWAKSNCIAHYREAQEEFEKQLKKAQDDLREESTARKRLSQEVRDRAREITKLQTRLDATKQRAALYDEANKDLERARHEIEILQTQKTSLERDLNTKTKNADNLSATIASLKGSLETVNTENEQKMATAKDEWTSKLAAAQKRKEGLDKTQAQHADQVRQLESQHKLELEAAAKNNLDEVKKLKRAQLDAASRHAAELAQLKAKYNDQLASAAQEQSKQRESLEQKHLQQVEKLEQERSNLISEHRKALQAQERRNEDLQRQHKSELTKKEEELTLLKSRHDAQLVAWKNHAAGLAAKHHDDEQALIRTQKQEMASLALKHQTELEVKEREMAQLISKHNDELEFLRSAQKQALLTKDDEMSRLMEVNKEQLMGLVSEHKKELLGKNRKMDRLSAGHKIELAELMAKHKTELDEKDRQKVQQAERYDQEICTLVAEQRKELDAKDYKHREELSAKNYEASVLVARHNSQLATMQNQMRELADRHKSECEVKDQEMKAVRNSVDHRILTATKEDRATIKELRRQIAAHYVQNYGYKEIADPEFADKFEILKQKVNQLANKVWEPATFDFHNSLDPTNFLVRNSHQLNWVWPRFVQSTCWSILLAGFFSLPLGFGALGNQGKGHEYMYPTYEAAALYGVNDQEERAFPNDNETNIYRILHFNRILEAIRLDKGSGDVTLARMLEDNIQHVGRQLYDTLGHIVNAQFDQGCATKAMEIARLVAELALDMGTQRSQVVLQMCRHEEKPNPTEWATEQASGASRQQAVDLMVHPCLARIGDGREDSHNKKVIVKGGYVPLAGGYR